MRALGGLATNRYAVSLYADQDKVLNTDVPPELKIVVDLARPPIDGFASFTGARPHLDGLVMVDADTVFAAGVFRTGGGFLGRLDLVTNTWSTNLPPAACEVHGVAALARSDVIAVGGCDGHGEIWHYDGAAWSQGEAIADIPGPFWSVSVFANAGGEDLIFAIGDAGLAWRDDTGTWHTDRSVAGRSISGSLDDLWIAGINTSVQHGAKSGGTYVWSRMTTDALGPMVISATAQRVLMPGSASGHVSLVREPQ
jgi:hypothetical protein